jgi:hypothetical protein
MSLDGNIFLTNEIANMVQHLEFAGPNSFEAGLMLNFGPWAAMRRGVCYRRSAVVNIPCNRVQNEFRNWHGAMHQGFLLDQWERGLQVDHRALYGLSNRATHEELNLTFVPRPACFL